MFGSAPRALVAPLVVAAFTLAFAPLHATTVLKYSDAEQARISTAVVIATVGKAESSIHPTWGRPITLTTLQIEETLYGEAPATVRIEQLMGEMDGIYSMIPGDAELREGERCVFFLRAEKGRWYLTALGQSKYAIVKTKDGDILERDMEMAFVERGADGKLHSTEKDSGTQTLGTFRKTIRSMSSKAPTPGGAR